MAVEYRTAAQWKAFYDSLQAQQIIVPNEFKQLVDVQSVIESGGGGPTGNVNIVGDTVGLNKEATQVQVLAALTGLATDLNQEATQLDVLTAITGLGTNLNQEATQLDVLTAITGLGTNLNQEATQLMVLAALTGLGTGLNQEVTQQQVLAALIDNIVDVNGNSVFINSITGASVFKDSATDSPFLLTIAEVIQTLVTSAQFDTVVKSIVPGNLSTICEVLTNSTAANLATDVQSFMQANGGISVMNQSYVFDGTDYNCFITYNT